MTVIVFFKIVRMAAAMQKVFEVGGAEMEKF